MSSPKRGTDPEQSSFELRAGVGKTDKWRGVRKQGSAATLLVGEIRDGINIRPDAGEGYLSRGGQARLISTPLTAAIDGIFEAGDIGGTY